MEKKWSVRKITTLAMLLAMALVLSIVDSLIPFGVPGLKLGLANLIILLAIYAYGFWVPLLLDLLRVLLASLCTGTFLGMGFVMSLSGALMSFLLMYCAKRWFKIFTPVGVSVLGAYIHALAQIVVAVIYMQNAGVFYYFPIMALISLATGTLNGVLVELLLHSKAISLYLGVSEQNPPKKN